MKYVAALLALTLSSASLAEPQVVNVYSSRGEALIQPLMDMFTQETGIEVQMLSAKPGALISRLALEGEATPADLLLTTDAGNLSAAARDGALQPIDSDVVDAQVPEYLRAEDKQWVALSIRGRVVVTRKDSDPTQDPARIEDLASDAYKDNICVRSSGNIYNQSLLASLISHDGEQAATQWAQGVRDNMARDPQGNDRAQIRAVAEKICDYGIVNTYYYGLMKSDPEQADTAEQTRLIFTNQNDRGNHINISGAGITKHAKHPENAKKLIEFMLGEKAQQWYAEANFEYPVRKGVAQSDMVQSFTPKDVVFDQQSVSRLGQFNAQAVKIFDSVGWQ